MKAYLLDTNIVSEVVKRPHGAMAVRIGGLPAHLVCTSIIVAAEARFGLARQSDASLTQRVEEVLGSMVVHSFEHPADQRYAELRAALERSGTPIGANDMLIAAHALALNCILVTADESEFRRVDGLGIENWLNDPV